MWVAICYWENGGMAQNISNYQKSDIRTVWITGAGSGIGAEMARDGT